MIIAHISDLHFGGNFNKEAFEEGIDEINSLYPDIVVVTGDITYEGLINEFEEAKKELSKLKCKELIVCSGNHDYRNTGYLLLKKFFSLKQVHKIKDTLIVALKTSRPDNDGGEVGYRQMLWLNKVLEENEENIKIVAIHHHVIPVPDTGLERHTVVDAGDLLLALTKTKPHLVLCGHRHRPWKWNLNEFPIIHAGSLSDRRLRGFFKNSYNIITVEKEKIEAKVKPVGEKEIEFDDLIKERMRVF